MGNLKIVTIFNQYKAIQDDFINSSDPEFLKWVGSINKKFNNFLMSKGCLVDISEKNCLDKDLVNKSSRSAHKNQDLKICQRHIITPQIEYEKNKSAVKDH